MVITKDYIIKRGNAISGAPLIKEQTDFQNLRLKQHHKKKNHNKACAVTMYYTIDNLI
jgi:hypothetical protein